MPTAIRLAALLAAAALVGALPRSARAEPQATAGLTVGAAGVGVERAVWSATVFHLGLRGDVLFGREGSHDFGVGPYAEVLTHAFDQVQVGAGLSGLLPVMESLPVVLSVGAYGRKGDDEYGFEPGVAAALFWGSRSYNFHSNYGMAIGLLAEGRVGLGSSGESSIVLGAQLDLVLLAMPAIFLFQAAKGGSPEAAPVTPSARRR